MALILVHTDMKALAQAVVELGRRSLQTDLRFINPAFGAAQFLSRHRLLRFWVTHAAHGSLCSQDDCDLL